jgi:hypothetical protein
MSKIHDDLFFNLNKIPDSVLENLSKFDINTLTGETNSNVLGFSKRLDQVNDFEFEKLAVLLSKLDSITLTKFMLNVYDLDDGLSKELVASINRMTEENNDSAKFISEKLISLYRLSLFVSVFNDSRLKALKIALRNY